MATATKKKESTVKMTPTQLRNENEKLKEKLEVLQNSYKCYMCDTPKKKDKFHVSTDPNNKSGVCPICKACAEKVACRADKNGVLRDPTKESVQEALKYENKPFLESVWSAAIQETENLISGSIRTNVWYAYCHIIAMVNYVGMTYFDSDIFKEKPSDIKDEVTEDEVIENHVGLDTYDSFIHNKEDVVRLLSYDPFEKEEVVDQPFLYSQLLGMLDSSEDANDDMVRVSSSIAIVRGFLQSSKIDDTITKLMSDVKNIEKNSATIKSLQDSKQKITSMITSLAEASCISLKHNKNAKKGENTWTGKTKKLKELNLREGEVNGFDMATCRAMKQVMDLSNESIMQQLHLDETEWSDIVAEQRNMIVDLQDKLEKYMEISRILLRENLDIKDTLKEKNIDLGLDCVNLNKLYSVFSEIKNDDEFEEIRQGDDNEEEK